MDGTHEFDNAFRCDVGQMARQIGLLTMVSIHVNADREIVRVVAGDHFRYYADAALFSRDAFGAPPPGDADVVVSNAYPMDVSLTFTHHKGIVPLARAAAGASRIAVASCPEARGFHGLSPFVDPPPVQEQREMLRRLAVMGTSNALRKLIARCWRRLQGRSAARIHRARPGHRFQSLAFLARGYPESLPVPIRGMVAKSSRLDVVGAVEREQGKGRRLRVAVYPCAPLQCIEDGAELAGVRAAIASDRAAVLAGRP
jgi:hypothetical protein